MMSSVPLFPFDILLNYFVCVCVLLDFNDGSKRKISIIINKIEKNIGPIMASLVRFAKRMGSA